MTNDDRLPLIEEILSQLLRADAATLQTLVRFFRERKRVTQPECVGRDELWGFAQQDELGIYDYTEEDVAQVWEYLLAEPLLDIRDPQTLEKIPTPILSGTSQAYVITIVSLQEFMVALGLLTPFIPLNDRQQSLLKGWVARLPKGMAAQSALPNSN